MTQKTLTLSFSDLQPTGVITCADAAGRACTLREKYHRHSSDTCCAVDSGTDATVSALAAFTLSSDEAEAEDETGALIE